MASCSQRDRKSRILCAEPTRPVMERSVYPTHMKHMGALVHELNSCHSSGSGEDTGVRAPEAVRAVLFMVFIRRGTAVLAGHRAKPGLPSGSTGLAPMHRL